MRADLVLVLDIGRIAEMLKSWLLESSAYIFECKTS